jgi:hypothetical protein
VKKSKGSKEGKDKKEPKKKTKKVILGNSEILKKNSDENYFFKG